MNSKKGAGEKILLDVPQCEPLHIFDLRSLLVPELLQQRPVFALERLDPDGRHPIK